MKHLILTLTASITLTLTTQAQAILSLEDCYRLTRENYPTVKKLDLVARTEGYTLANANRAYLPQLSILGQATYQSEVTDLSKTIVGALPLPPNVSLPMKVDSICK